MITESRFLTVCVVLAIHLWSHICDDMMYSELTTVIGAIILCIIGVVSWKTSKN